MLSGSVPNAEILIFNVSPDKIAKSPFSEVRLNGVGGLYDVSYFTNLFIAKR